MTPSKLSAQTAACLAGHNVLVIGDIMLDAYLMGDTHRISPEAPVPVLRVEQERHLLGGAGNVARNIVALGGQATLIGITGTDAAADTITRLLHDEGIIPALLRLPHRPTTVKTRVIARRQQMLRLDQEDDSSLANQDLQQLLAVIDANLDGHDVVILSDYNKGLVSEACMKGLGTLLETRSPVPKLLIDPKPAHTSLYAGAYLLTPNTRETGECAGMPVTHQDEIVAAGLALLERAKCTHLLTTLGPEGMALFLNPSEVWHIPTTAQDVFDVTGAGDTVIATIGLALAAKLDALTSCLLANYAAGLVVAQVGAATASPSSIAHAIASLPAPVLTRWK